MCLLSPSCRTGEFDVETGIEGFARRVGTVPIGNDDTLVSPLFSKNSFQEIFALGYMGPIDLFVSRSLISD